ncbi:MAG: hypothetical protein P9L91_06330, partial [Candidatus Zophobacter franzmannii]|nr:hypothetical protein [Candidatus Zophobacter franzmannii]
TGDMLVHLDPDISENVYDRGNNEWGPMFGQDGSAQGHLRKQTIGKGDIFLFFGLYGWVSKNEGKYRYVRGEKKFHMLWGLMQIEDVIHFDNPDEINRVKEWMKSHPHFYLQGAKQNTLYIGRKDLIVDGKLIAQNCGTGTFEKYRDELQLTRKGSHKLTDWLVPSFLFNSDKKKLPTYHQNHNLWNQEEDKYNLKAASIGQEFVFDCAEHPGAIDWLKKLIKGEEQ